MIAIRRKRLNKHEYICGFLQYVLYDGTNCTVTYDPKGFYEVRVLTEKGYFANIQIYEVVENTINEMIIGVVPIERYLKHFHKDEIMPSINDSMRAKLIIKYNKLGLTEFSRNALIQTSCN